MSSTIRSDAIHKSVITCPYCIKLEPCYHMYYSLCYYYLRNRMPSTNYCDVSSGCRSISVTIQEIQDLLLSNHYNTASLRNIVMIHKDSRYD